MKCTIDDKKITVLENTSILDAARKAGITIPTMCHVEGFTPFTSCMICVVRDEDTGCLVPSCSTRVQDGMTIRTHGDEVTHARKTAVELLLSEHIGDCEGPCRMACPAHMDIPLMLDHIEAGRFRDALVTVKEHIALPAVLGRICSAPCEKGCRRTQIDSPVAVCLLKRFVAEYDLLTDSPYIPECRPSINKKVAVIGSGPAGLAAAYYLLIEGLDCTIFEKSAKPGGMLRYGVPEVRLPHSILNAEIDIIRKMGAEIRCNTKIDKDVSTKEIQKRYDAVLIASGASDSPSSLFGETLTEHGIAVKSHTHQTDIAGIFATGGAVKSMHMAVRAVAQGRTAALAVHQYVMTGTITPHSNRFNSRIGKLLDGESDSIIDLAALARNGETADGLSDAPIQENDISPARAASEAARCLHCECLKPDGCKLRNYADEYEAKPHQFKGDSRHPIEKTYDHPNVVYETGKCIRCGLCVRITEKHEELGLTFIGRGFDVRVGAPLNKSLDRALTRVADECVQACPTGALALRTSTNGKHQPEKL